MATLDQLQTWLGEAESARHALAMGEALVEVWRDGRRVTYSKASLNDLQSYIDWLNAEIARVTAQASGKPRRRALGFRWSGCQ